MRKHWLVAAAATLVAAAAGATFATYAEQSKPPAKQLGAGTLTLNLQVGGSLAKPWDPIGPLTPQIDAPALESRRVLATNTGSVPGFLSYQAVELKDLEKPLSAPYDACLSPERRAENGDCGQEGELSRQLQVEVWRYAYNSQTGKCTLPISPAVSRTSLKNLAVQDPGRGVTLASGEKACLEFQFLLPDGSQEFVTDPVTNAIQGDYAMFKMQFSLGS